METATERRRIEALDEATIDRIAAGEVVERPASVAKELVENAIDAEADAITVEIQDGGITLIRVSDNGIGIPKDQISSAFLRHTTSKIRTAEDLTGVRSLGFRGEALSSIAAVSKVEVITKTKEELTGCDYVIEGSQEIEQIEVGAPEGTSFFVRALFYNTLGRRKFLKSPMTEGNYVNDVITRLALSHPDISFRFIVNNREKLHTAGNGSLKDVILAIFGRSVAKELLDIEAETPSCRIYGLTGTPQAARASRTGEMFFVNGRLVKSRILSDAVEEGYHGYLMSHQYPFSVLFFEFDGEQLDVNVHPTKQEVRFSDAPNLHEEIAGVIRERLSRREDIGEAVLSKEEKKKEAPVRGAEPFELNRLAKMKEEIAKEVRKDSPYAPFYNDLKNKQTTIPEAAEDRQTPKQKESVPVQQTFLSKEAKERHRIIGQVFGTYWLIEFEDKFYIIDQHAAHEKVLYERFMKQLSEKEMTSQQVSPPIICALSVSEEQAFLRNRKLFAELGFTVEAFGGKEYALSAIPDNLTNIDKKQLFYDIVSRLAEEKKANEEMVKERIASMSCKAAVKGNSRLSLEEVDALLEELFTLENPYHCPHGRPTIVSMSRYELDKQFKRIV